MRFSQDAFDMLEKMAEKDLSERQKTVLEIIVNHTSGVPTKDLLETASKDGGMSERAARRIAWRLVRLGEVRFENGVWEVQSED